MRPIVDIPSLFISLFHPSPPAKSDGKHVLARNASACAVKRPIVRRDLPLGQTLPR
jgi:hypothetical protein